MMASLMFSTIQTLSETVPNSCNVLFAAQIAKMEKRWNKIPKCIEWETDEKAERSAKVGDKRDERIEVELRSHLCNFIGGWFHFRN